MKEEKIDRLIRETVNDEFFQNPSKEFTGQVMEKLGVKGQDSKLSTRPLRYKWGLWSMVIIYSILILTVIILPGSLMNSAYQLPEIQLPSISKFISFSSDISRLLVVLIFGGWFLIFIDKFARRIFFR